MSCRRLVGGSVVMSLLAVSVAGCGGSQASEKSKSVIHVEGSDTMVNLAQAWAEGYNQQFPGVEVQVSGGGSGVGIASLINGVCDMADASREMSEREFKAVQDNNGKKAVEFTVARDALSVYVHKYNPMDTISLEELAEIYGEGGQVTKWSQLGVNFFGCTRGDHPRQPSEQLGHLRVLPRGGARQARLQARLD